MGMLQTNKIEKQNNEYVDSEKLIEKSKYSNAFSEAALENPDSGISVIIPTFNRAKYLYSTLICLTNQKLEKNTAYEIIIIDSGNDETENIVKLFTNTRIPIIYQKITQNNNRSLVRNTGASLARFSYLCFIDNDMMVSPDFIQIQINEHKKESHAVLLGVRKSLVNYDLNIFGSEALTNNFSLLEKLPWYGDERTPEYLAFEPWRWVFSHTLGLSKEDFNRAGGFNIQFGENWGYEDLEFGFVLQINGCKIKLLQNCISYHQPHFSQSVQQQHTESNNAQLFLKLHNSYSVELYNAFYTSFNDFYPALHELSKKFAEPSADLINKFDMIFGCLFNSEDRKKYGKMQLGCFSIEDYHSCNSLLILDTFFDFPQTIQMGIITEAFRVSKKIYFNKLDENKINQINIVCDKTGIDYQMNLENEYSVLQLSNKKQSKFRIILLADISQPEKRYIYKWLSKQYIKEGYCVSINDMKNVFSFEGEDFDLSDEDNKLLASKIKRSYGYCDSIDIVSSDLLLSELDRTINHSDSTYVFYDDDYYLKYDSVRRQFVERYNCFDESIVSLISLLSVYENTVNTVIPEKNEYDFCIFMENGFLEDGIDLCLETFSKYLESDPNAKLLIKQQDIVSQLKNAFPLHNESSKYAKEFSVLQNAEKNKNLLRNKIQELKLSENVDVVCECLSLNNIIEIIAKSNSLLLTSRGSYVPPQVYISILLKKKTIISEHHNIVPDLYEFCHRIPFEEKLYTDEMKMPVSCGSINYTVNRINKNNLLSEMSKESIKVDSEKLEKIAKKFEKNLKKMLFTT